MLKRSGKETVMISFALRSGLRLGWGYKKLFEKAREGRGIFRCARIELHREPNFRGRVNNLRPEIYALHLRQVDLEMNQFFYCDLPASQHEAAAAAQISYGRLL